MDLEDQVDNYKQEVIEYRRQINDQNNRYGIGYIDITFLIGQ